MLCYVMLRQNKTAAKQNYIHSNKKPRVLIIYLSIMLSIVFIFSLSLSPHANLNSNVKSRLSIPSYCSSGPVGRLILLAKIFASNKSALCRIASFAFSFVLRKFNSIHSRNVGSKLKWYDISHSRYDQVSKQGIRWPVSQDLMTGSSFGPLRLRTCLKSSADKFLAFNRSQAQHYFFYFTQHMK